MRLRLLFAIAAVLAGCTVGPDYQRPEIATPAAWKSAPEAASNPWPTTAWWASFRSPVLTSFIDQAQRANYDIAAAAARIAQADARVRVSGAALLPTIDAGADAARSRFGTSSSSSRGSRAVTSYSASLAASYELDFWGKNRSTLASAQSLALASRYDR
ncbi:MAG TPA: TolC family protein, partial [Alphaproteobacteria bacterium]|nr:TolC family protein [Alphaproteobacteria bacterium]